MRNPGDQNNAARDFSTWLAAIVYIFLILEGSFKVLIENQFSDGTAFWSRAFPVNLFPSEVLFIVIGLPVSILLIPSAFSCRPRVVWLLLSGVLLAYSLLQMMHGLRNGAGNNAYIYFKAFGFKLMWVPLFVSVAMTAHLDRMMEIVWRFSCAFSIYVITYGVVMIAQGNLATKDQLSANFTGSQLMILPMIFGFFRYVMTRRMMWLYGSGFIWVSTVVPLEKPAITASLAAIAIMWLAVSFIGSGHRAQQSILGSYIGVGVLLALFAASVFFVLDRFSDGEWLTYLETRYFKVGLKQDDVSSGRFFMWEWAFDMWLRSPLVGHGIGVLYPGPTEFVGVHNIPLELLYTTGALGFVLYYYWAFMPLVSGWAFFKYVNPRAGTGVASMVVWLTVIHLANLFGNTTTVQTMSFAYVGCTVFLAVATAGRPNT